MWELLLMWRQRFREREKGKLLREMLWAAGSRLCSQKFTMDEPPLQPSWAVPHSAKVPSQPRELQCPSCLHKTALTALSSCAQGQTGTSATIQTVKGEWVWEQSVSSLWWWLVYRRLGKPEDTHQDVQLQRITWRLWSRGGWEWHTEVCRIEGWRYWQKILLCLAVGL